MSYLVFAGTCYYASGGLNDFVGCYDTFEEAKKIAEDLLNGNYEYESSRDKEYHTYEGIGWYQIAQANSFDIVDFHGEPHNSDYGISSDKHKIRLKESE